MSSIPACQFNLSGASGSQGLLSPKDGWYCYIFPRGGFASQDSTGALITFDSSAIASRFAVNNWIQVSTDTSKIRKVSAVGGNSISVSGAVVTVTKNDRVLVIGNTQPTVSGSSATYIIPQSIIRQRDDDSADIFTNSKVTSDSNGLIRFFSSPAIYDALIQDGNQTAQGYIADLPVGAVEGISTSDWAFFGSTVTIHGALGVTGWATFGSSVTIAGALGVTGTGYFGSTLTAGSNFGVTGTAVFGQTITLTGTSGNYSQTGAVTFGNTVSVTGGVSFGSTASFSGNATFGSTATFSTAIKFHSLYAVGSMGATISSGWGSTASITHIGGNGATVGAFLISAGGAGIGASPTVTLTGMSYPVGTQHLTLSSRAHFGSLFGGASQPNVNFLCDAQGSSGSATLLFAGLPVAGESYGFTVLVVGFSS